jgi:hypothetical protein
LINLNQRFKYPAPRRVAQRSLPRHPREWTQAGSFGQAATHRAERFAQNASGALSIAVRLADHIALTDQLRASLASRAVIDQAIGVLMGQRRITAAEAFAILRTTSQNRNVKLRAFAAQIVEGAGAQPPQPPPFDPPR